MQLADRTAARRRVAAGLVVAATLAVVACSHRRGAGPPGGGGGGGGGNPDVPAAPAALRLGPHPDGPPRYQLEWAAATAVALDHFTVYQALAPIPAPDAGAALPPVDPGSRTLAVDLPTDSGQRYFRIEAVSVDGETSDLSAELVVDTAGRLAYAARPAATAAHVDLFALVPGSTDAPTNLSNLPATAAIAEFAVAPDGRSAAFVADRDAPTVRELFVAALDAGTPAVKVSGTMAIGGGVLPGTRFSPDGRTIAFAADRQTAGTAELWIAPVDGSAAPQKRSGAMTQGGSLAIASRAEIAWAPDGRHLAYLADQRFDGALELFVAPTDGSAAAIAASGQLVPTASLIQFAWSPDGSTLAFTADRRTDGVFELFTVPADGSAEPTVRSGAQLANADVFALAWSPDGNEIAFVSTRRSSSLLEVYVASADGTGEPIALDATLPSFAGATRFLWSPDGTRIAFACDRAVDGQFELYVADHVGVTAAVKVSGAMTLRGDVAEFAWSPDGTALAFRADRIVDDRFELFVTAPGFVGEPGARSGAMPANGDLLDFAWSPAGDRIGFRADLVVDQQFEQYVVARDGTGGPVPLGTAGSTETTPAAAWALLGRR